MECEPRGVQGRAPIVGEGAVYGRTGAPYDLDFRITPACELSFKGAHPPDPLFQCLLGMAVGFIDGLCSLAERRKVTELVWDVGEGLGHGAADGGLAIGDDPHDRHL
jgi:hypothetical protein